MPGGRSQDCSNRHKRRRIRAETNSELATLRSEISSQNQIEINKSYADDISLTNHFSYVSNNDGISTTSGISDERLEDIVNKVLVDNYLFTNEEDISTNLYEEDIINDDFEYQFSDNDSNSSQIDEDQCLHQIEDSGNEHLFVKSIKKWALDYNIKQNALKSLLQILNENTNVKFPKDPRTLLRTPTHYEITQLSHGQYCHLGFKNAVERCIHQLNSIGHFQYHENKLEIQISTDGAPLGKSNSLSMWPILCLTFNMVQVIGIFVGDSKPKDANEFFTPFINEVEDVQKNGFIYNDITFSIHITGLIFDTPAKSFALNVKYHSGYNSCTKCTIHGANISNTVCFPNEEPEPALRTDEGFRNFQYSENFDDDYQKHETILVKINNLGLVSGVPLDYMHLVCLGVMRKLILLWMNGPLTNRLSYNQITKISEDLTSIRLHVPADFPRKPRSLKLIKLWKATELRNFLLYYGPIVLKNELNEKAYNHFLILHVAIRLLADPEAVKQAGNIDCANELLQQFVKTFGDVYEKKYISINVHNLKHLALDVKTFGCLDKFSAFPFENFICSLKKLIRKGAQPLQQLVRRLGELDHIVSRQFHSLKNVNSFSKQHYDGPITYDRKFTNQYRVMHKGSLYFNSDDENNNCVLLKDKSIVKIFNFAESEKKYYIIGEKLEIIDNMYKYPFDSKLFNICLVKKTNKIRSWPCMDIYAKMFKMQFKQRIVVFPILHTSVN